MAIRGLENIATEIRKKEDKYMRYTVLVEEVVSQEFAMEASSPEEALRLVKDQYSKGKIVLEPGNLEQVSMKIVGDAE
jgi:hypothetical protein